MQLSCIMQPSYFWNILFSSQSLPMPFYYLSLSPCGSRPETFRRCSFCFYRLAFCSYFTQRKLCTTSLLYFALWLVFMHYHLLGLEFFLPRILHCVSLLFFLIADQLVDLLKLVTICMTWHIYVQISVWVYASISLAIHLGVAMSSGNSTCNFLKNSKTVFQIETLSKNKVERNWRRNLLSVCTHTERWREGERMPFSPLWI